MLACCLDSLSRSRDAFFCARGLRHGTDKRRRAFDRVTPKKKDRAVGPASARSRLAQVARIERSEIRERNCGLHCRPRVSLRSTHPTNKRTNKNKAGGTPADANSTSAPYGCGSAPSGARCAYRRSTAALAAANQRRHSAPDALPGTWLKSGGWPPPPVPVQRSNRRPVVMPAGRVPEAAQERR